MSPSKSLVLAAVAAWFFVGHSVAQDSAGPTKGAGRGSPELERLLGATGTAALEIPKSSTTQREFYRRFGAWAKGRWQAKVQAELDGIQVEDAEKVAGQLWDWYAAGAAGGKVGPVTEAMRAKIPEKASAPITQFIVGNMALESRFWDESRRRLHRCVDETKDGRGDVLIAALAAARLNGDKSRQQDGKLQEKTLKLLGQAFAEGNFGEDDGDFLAHILCCRLAGLAHEKMGDRLIPIWEKAALPEWVRQYAIGKARVAFVEPNRIWNAGSLARMGSPEGRLGPGDAGTEESAASKAAKCFRKSWELHPQRPEAAMEMIDLAPRRGERGEAGEETARLWFDRAIAAECDHRFAYTKMISRLRLRWGGRHDELLAFGVACARTERYDTDVPGKLLETLDILGEEIPDWRPVLQHPEIAALLMKFRHARVAQTREEGKEGEAQLSTARAYLAVTAMLCGDRKAALATLRTMHPEGEALSLPISAVNWAAGWNMDWSTELAEAQLEDSEASDAWEKAKEAREKRYFDTALAEFDGIVEKCPAARGWLKGWQSCVAFERDFAKGEWLAMPHNLVMWLPGYGEWKWAAPQELVGKLSTNSSLYLYSRARLGENFAIRGKFRLETNLPDRKLSFGVLFGHALFCKQNAQPEYVALFTTTDRNHFRSEIGHRHWLRDIRTPGANVKLVETNTFRVERRGTQVNAWVNDEQALKDAEIPEGLPDGEGSIGLMAYPFVAQEPVHIMELEAKKL